MKKPLALLLFVVGLSTSLIAQAVSVGMTESDIVKLKGAPQSKGKKSIYRWPDVEAIIVEGKVASFKVRDAAAEQATALEVKRAVAEREHTDRMKKENAAAEARAKVQDSREATVYSRLDANAANRATEERLRRAASIQQQIQSIESQLSADAKRSSFRGPAPMTAEARALLNFRLDSLRSELATLR